MGVFFTCLVPILPLLAGGWLLVQDFRKKPVTGRASVAMTAGSFFLSAGVLAEVVRNGPVLVSLPGGLFGTLFGPGVPWGIDRLSGIMLLLISGVSTVVQGYSIRYMQGEARVARFFGLIALETSVLMMLVTSHNLLMLFVFWQLMSLGLYLLMVHNETMPSAVMTASKTFLIHRAGDLFFLGGLLLVQRTFGTMDIDRIGAMLRAASPPPLFTLSVAGSPVALSSATVITLLIFVGCMAKSAQFPLHMWLPDTMDTPTPVSALMHAGIVNVGGYVMNRLSLLFSASPSTMHFVFLTGLLTTVLGSTIMLTQSDVKRKLGFSTMGQMGYMTMECGLGAFSLAVFHLIAHGLFKATMFLESGSGIGNARREPPLPPAPAGPGTPGKALNLSPSIPAAAVTLLLPLIILLGAHQFAGISLSREEGTVVFLFFSWVTVSQTAISLLKARVFESWKWAIPWTMLLVLFVFGYIGAGRWFNLFLYPDPADRARFFASGGIGWFLFTPLVLVISLLIIGGWIWNLLLLTRGKNFLPRWFTEDQERIYLYFMNRGGLDSLASHLVRTRLERMFARMNGWIG